MSFRDLRSSRNRGTPTLSSLSLEGEARTTTKEYNINNSFEETKNVKRMHKSSRSAVFLTCTLQLSLATLCLTGLALLCSDLPDEIRAKGATRKIYNTSFRHGNGDYLYPVCGTVEKRVVLATYGVCGANILFSGATIFVFLSFFEEHLKEESILLALAVIGSLLGGLLLPSSAVALGMHPAVSSREVEPDLEIICRLYCVCLPCLLSFSHLDYLSTSSLKVLATLIAGSLSRSLASVTFHSLYASAVLVWLMGLVTSLALSYLNIVDFFILSVALAIATVCSRGNMVERRERMVCVQTEPA